MPADFTERLCSLSDIGFKDATEDLLRLYLYKADADVAGLKLTHRLAAIAVKVFYQQVIAGITESKLAALIEFAVQEMIGDITGLPVRLYFLEILLCWKRRYV